jgi:nucleoid-associated protein YgaU
MDHDYELDDEYPPRILWARLAFFAVALLLAFVAGRACAPNGVPQSEFKAVQDEVFELASEKALLEQRLSTAGGGKNNNKGGGKNSGGKNSGGNDNTDEEEASEPATDDEASGGQQTYEVQSGDTLTTIAEKFYGDATEFTLIVDANNLDDATGLRVGQELIIPAND